MGPDAKEIQCEKFSRPPFSQRKIGVNPTEYHIDSIFMGKVSMIFSDLQNFKGPPFVHQPPLQVFVNGPLLHALSPIFGVVRKKLSRKDRDGSETKSHFQIRPTLVFPYCVL